MRVYLVQHGESKPEEEDPQRRLTDEGVRNVQKVAGFLRPLGLKLETIWHSDKPRAQQTAEILAGAISASQGMLQRNDLAPKDPVAPVKQAIEQSAGDLMIVGHLPFLGKLVALLVADNEETEIVTFRRSGSAALCVSSALRMAHGSWRG
jgi:phosphohistidine phosphatase